MNDMTVNQEMTPVGGIAAAVLSGLPRTVPAEEDYTGEDGLLYCGRCHTPKEAYHKPEHAALLKTDRHPVECACRRAERVEREAAETRRKHRAEVERLKRDCFFQPMLWDWDFAHDNGLTPQMGYARKYVERWDEAREKNLGLLLWGAPGSGKSYLAASIANGLIEKHIPVCMTTFPRVIGELSGRNADRGGIIETLCRPPLLIIDDLGAEYGSDYRMELVFDVIDSRYCSGRPLILTTNLPLDEIRTPPDLTRKRIYSRVEAMCAPILCTGQQDRREQGREKMRLLREMMDR